MYVHVLDHKGKTRFRKGEPKQNPSEGKDICPIIDA